MQPTWWLDILLQDFHRKHVKMWENSRCGYIWDDFLKYFCVKEWKICGVPLSCHQHRLLLGTRGAFIFSAELDVFLVSQSSGWMLPCITKLFSLDKETFWRPWPLEVGNTTGSVSYEATEVYLLWCTKPFFPPPPALTDLWGWSVWKTFDGLKVSLVNRKGKNLVKISR